MTKKRLYVATLMLLGLTAPLSANAEWVELNKSDSSDLLLNTDVKIEGDLRRVWGKINFHKIENQSVPVRSSRFLFQINCKEGRSRVLEITSFSEKDNSGRTISESAEPTPWRYPAPNTSNALVMDVVCKV